MCSWMFGKRARVYMGLAVAVFFAAVLALGATGSWVKHDGEAGPASSTGIKNQAALQLTSEPLTDQTIPITFGAAQEESSAPGLVSTVPAYVSAATTSPGVTGGLLTGLVLAWIGGLGVIMAIVLMRGRRSRLVPIGMVLMAVVLTAGLATPALAGTGTLTRWTSPHTFSNYAYALAKDPSSNLIYFAEHMNSGADPGRIGQLNLTTNDLVEWPTTAVLGNSMAVVGGKVFFTEPTANIIGRLDPMTDTFTRWQLPTAGGDALIFWVEGSENVWYFSASAAKIGRLTPATDGSADITEWVLASQGTAIRFYGRDANGYMWFSIPAEAKVGRLDLIGNQVSQWTLPTELVSVVAVKDNLVWFSGAKDNYSAGIWFYTIHFGRLDTSSNQVTRWTVVPTDTPGWVGLEVGYYKENWATWEAQVTTGRFKQLGVVDSTGKPWFLTNLNTTSNKLISLDPVKNQLLEFDFVSLELMDIDSADVITAQYPGYNGMIVFFDTKTDSETRYSLPWPSAGYYTTLGLLRISDGEFWYTRSMAAGLPAEVERLVIQP